MIEVPILKDIRSYETYLIGHFTTRQLICGGIAIGGAYLVYYAQKLMGIEEPVKALMLVAAVPGAAFGWVKPYGLKLEKFLKTAFIDNFIAPKVRPYKIENPIQELVKYSGMLDEDDTEIVGEEDGKKKVRKKVKTKNKDLPEEWQSYK